MSFGKMKEEETPNSKPLKPYGFLPTERDYSNPSAHELLFYAQALENLSKISEFPDLDIQTTSNEICRIIKSRVEVKGEK